MPDRPAITNSNAIANVVTSLGAEIVPGRTFLVRIPRSDVKTFVPQVDAALGLGCRTVSEEIAEHPLRLGDAQTLPTLEFYNR
jgi:hypothetical protein